LSTIAFIGVPCPMNKAGISLPVFVGIG
jgi:hypothetical protein